MKLRYKVLAVVALLLVVRFYGRNPFATSTTVVPPVIPPSANAVVQIKPNGVVLARRNPTSPNNTTATAIPNYGHGVDVIVRKDGGVDVKPRQFGFSEDLGLSTDFSSVGVANEFIYWKRLSLLGGSHFLNLRTQRPQLNLFVAVGFRLPWAKVNNVSTYVGFDTDRKVIGGLFLRFGNS